MTALQFFQRLPEPHRTVALAEIERRKESFNYDGFIYQMYRTYLGAVVPSGNDAAWAAFGPVLREFMSRDENDRLWFWISVGNAVDSKKEIPPLKAITQ